MAAPAPLILPVRGITPRFGADCWLAPNATVVGDVVMGTGCSVWFQAVVRGDVNAIRIGDRVNIQDGAVIHCTYQRSVTEIGDDVSIGHKAVIHGCRIERDVLVGMGAIVMDGAVIGTGSVIAAGAVVLEGTIVEPGSIYAGVPARKVKSVSPELREGEVRRIARNYLMYSGWFRNDSPEAPDTTV
jgi:carbonic anhydrase/acetyltransferase-like protein (isoleucine patch superfamily)